MDASGNLYIFDSSHSVIQLVTAGAGIITTVVGTASSAALTGVMATLL